ncbi:MAG TPA: acyloxyacyl hydrolase [Casimicrobiaceae bacterium]|nr:acyloxyacyl hydrolase [Casimicrobiaceae bacterium]
MVLASLAGATADGVTARLAATLLASSLKHGSSTGRLGIRARRWIFASTLLAAALPRAALASDGLTPDGVALTAGYGKSVGVLGLAANWNFAHDERSLVMGVFEPRLVAGVSYWHGTQEPNANPSLWDFGLMPVLRWSAPGTASPRFFAEAGVGVHMLTATRINNNRTFSTAFQFGEQAGVGLAFGPEHRYELGAYIQHVSNARIKEPNDGLTYFGLLFRVATR